MNNTPSPKSLSSVSPCEYIACAGKLNVYSKWYLIDQTRIDQFADVTHDHQFIHIDEKRAKDETPFGGTIAHGFLSLSMLSAMIANALPPIENASLSINYGFDRIRFLSPVPSGAKIRAHIKLTECSERKRNASLLDTSHQDTSDVFELLSRYEISVEIEGNDKPALVAQWLGLTIIEQEKT